MSANEKQVAGTHYKTTGIQHWDLIHDNDVGYLAGNATKYLCRFRRKGGAQDLQKALHYVEKMIEKHNNFAGRASGNVGEMDLTEFFADNGLSGPECVPIRLILNWKFVSHLDIARNLIQTLLSEFEESDGSEAGPGYVKQDRE